MSGRFIDVLLHYWTDELIELINTIITTTILVSRPPKGTFLRGTASFDVFCVKICARVSAVAFLKNQKK